MSLTGKSTADVLADELRKMINSGALSDGERLLGNASEFEMQGRYNHEFHDLLYSGCKNKRLLTMINELRNQTERYAYLQRRLLANTHQFQDCHEAILTACQENNAERARREIIQHINTAGNVLKDFINGRDPVSN